MAEARQDVTVGVKADGNGVDQFKQFLATLKDILATEQKVKQTATETADQRRQAAQAAQQEAAARKRAAEEERRAHKERMVQAGGGPRSGMVAPTPLAGGPSAAGGGMSAMGGAGGVGAIATAIARAVETGMNKASAALEINNQAFSTTAQKRRQMTEEFMPFGESLNRLSDAITGVAAKIERETLRFAVASAQQQVRIQQGAALRPVEAEQRTLIARSQAAERFNMPAPGYIDRSTVGGAQAYQEQQIRLPAQQALAQAQMEASAARDAAGREAGRETGMRADLEAAEREFRRRVQRSEQMRLDENVSGVRKQAERTQAHNDVELAAADVAAKSAALAEQARIAKEAGARAVEAESQARKAGIELQRAELEILKQREQRMASIAQGVGAMGRGGRQAAVRALQRFIKRGPENSTEAEMGLAARIAPEYVRQQQERYGEQFIRSQVRGRLGDRQFENVFSSDFAKNETLSQLRRSQQQVQVSIASQINLDTRATAAALAQQVAPLIQALKDAFDAQFRNAEGRTRENAYRQSNSSQGAARR